MNRAMKKPLSGLWFRRRAGQEGRDRLGLRSQVGERLSREGGGLFRVLP